MTVHRLKIWPEYLTAIENGTKTFEVRVNDRNFMEGDTLVLCEYDIDTDTFTGKEIVRTVGWAGTCFIDTGLPTSWAPPKAHAIMSLLPEATP